MSWFKGFKALSRLTRTIAIFAAAGAGPATFCMINSCQHTSSNSISGQRERLFALLNIADTNNFELHTKIKALLETNTPVLFKAYYATCKDRPGHRFDFIADAVEIALPTVVSIEIVQDHFVYQAKGSGSGFIVDKRGYVITNEHVIAGNRNLTVVLSDGKKLPGCVVAVDSCTDLALIKVEANIDLPEIVLGDDENLRPGQWVAAIGNGLEFHNTVTAGIISNVSRNINENRSLHYHGHKIGHTNYIQTDAAVNPGSSGGPLINLNGEVIAVNTMGIGVGSGNGVAFSIPVSEVKRFLKEFTDGSQNQKDNYSLGLRIVTLTADMARFLHENGQLDASVNGGIYVFDTLRNSPAHMKGLVKGDIIIGIDNVKIMSRNDMTHALQTAAGKPVTVTFYRPQMGLLKTEITPLVKRH